VNTKTLIAAVHCGLLLMADPVAAMEFSLRGLAIPERNTGNEESPFFLPESFTGKPMESFSKRVEVGIQSGGFRMNAMGEGVFAEGHKPDYDGRLNEMVLDFGLWNQDWSLGKKVLSWGVGFAFRPLDVVQRENRRVLFSAASEGVPLATWQTFSDTGSVTAVLANPGRKPHGQHTPRDDQSIAVGLFQSIGAVDLHGVARYSERQKAEVGAGFFHVVGESLEWHGSLLRAGRYERKLNLLASAGGNPLAQGNPLQVDAKQGVWRGLIGMGWSGPANLGWLMEAWRDEMAYSRPEWEALIQLTRTQRQLLGLGFDRAVYGNIAASLDYFNSPSLTRDNLFFRFSYDKEPWYAGADMLHSITDGGRSLTVSQGYQWSKTKLHLYYRRYGGQKNAVFRMLPYASTLVVVGELSF